MGNLNKVMLIGRIGQEPEKRITPQGHSVVTISIATSERFNDRQGQRQEKTEWHRVVFWNKMADLIEQYCKKGSQLYVEGSLQTNEWQDKDGNKRYTTEIQGRNMQFLDPPSGAGAGAGQGAGQSTGQSNYQAPPQGGGQQQGGQQQGQGQGPAQGQTQQYGGQPQGGGYNPPPPPGNYPPGPAGGPPQGGNYNQQGGGKDDFIEDDIPF